MLGQCGPSGRQSGAGDAKGPGVQMVMGQAAEGCGATALGEALPGSVRAVGDTYRLRWHGPDPGDSDWTGKTTDA